MKGFKKTLIVGILLSILFLIAGCDLEGFKRPTTSERDTFSYVNRKQIKNKRDFTKRFNTLDIYYGFENMRDMAVSPEAMEMDVALTDPQRDYVDTNVQVENVDEADIIKTDGNRIYYNNSDKRSVYVFNVLNDGVIEIEKEINPEDMMTSSLYITEQYLILIGMKQRVTYSDYLDYRFGLYFSPSGIIQVYSKDDLELVYELETNNYFSDYRLIEDKLFLISNHRVTKEELVPHFKETINDNEHQFNLPYTSVYYFDQDVSTGLTTYSVLDLSNLTLKSEAYSGYSHTIYMNEEHLYSTKTIYTGYDSETEIIKFSFNLEDGTIDYRAQGKVKGYLSDSYWMDEYENKLRIVTTQWNPVRNYLHILEENKNNDKLEIIGKIDEGLGKPNETVKAVRFNGATGHVVTFEQTDPLYTIDLSDPKTPVITGAIEEPGYSTYLHVWNDEGTQLIGIGYDADLTGRVTGIKISAYSSEEEDPLVSYILKNEEGNMFSWNYGEALNNPKALLISPKIGIVGFSVSSYGYSNELGYTSYSRYLIFKIDFDAENNEDIIKNPIEIQHQSDNYVYVDRGIYIKQDGDNAFEIIYTFSNMSVISYDLENDEIVQTLDLQ